MWQCWRWGAAVAIMQVVTQDQDATAVVVTVADESGRLWRELLGKVAGCFPRRETRENATEVVSGVLASMLAR